MSSIKSNRVMPDAIPEDESMDSFKSSNSSFIMKVGFYGAPPPLSRDSMLANVDV